MVFEGEPMSVSKDNLLKSCESENIVFKYIEQSVVSYQHCLNADKTTSEFWFGHQERLCGADSERLVTRRAF